MDVAADISAIRRAFCEGTYDFTDHGASSLLKRGINERDVVAAICHDAPEVIEDYPADGRGPACLVLGWVDLARPLHVEVGYGRKSSDWVDVITVYEPDADRWYNHRRRR